MQVVIGLVWLTSVLYSTPKFLFVQTITNKLGNQTGKKNDLFETPAIQTHSKINPYSICTKETICIVNRRDYNVKLFDILNFVLLYILPLMVMTVSVDLCFFSPLQRKRWFYSYLEYLLFWKSNLSHSRFLTDAWNIS